MIEQWKKIDGFPNYEVSDFGNLRTFKARGKELPHIRAKHLGGNGYFEITLYKNGKPKHIKISRLVATTFVKNPFGKKTVNHINGIKTDDRAVNLEWVTSKENTAHAIKTGLIKMNGEMSRNALISDKQARVIKHALSFGVRGTGRMLAKMCGVHESTISKIAHGKNWKHLGREKKNADFLSGTIKK